VGRARTLSASPHTRTLYTANDLGDPGIMSFRTDKERVVRGLCQPASPRLSGGAWRVSGASGRQGRDHPKSLIGVCMKVGAVGFSDTFVIALLSPNLLDIQQHKDLTGAADPYTDVFARTCTS
jgi:hypothetical protein